MSKEQKTFIVYYRNNKGMMSLVLHIGTLSYCYSIFDRESSSATDTLCIGILERGLGSEEEMFIITLLESKE